MGRVFVFKNATWVEIISSLFILLFLYTALAKTYQITPTTSVLRSLPVLSKAPDTFASILVGLEYVAALLLFIPKTRKAGLYTSFGLMTMFTLYITYMMIFVPDLPCSCGGIISKLTWKQHLFVNVFFIILALIAIILMRRTATVKENNPIPIVYT
jgi:putative oxidoreductase